MLTRILAGGVVAAGFSDAAKIVGIFPATADTVLARIISAFNAYAAGK